MAVCQYQHCTSFHSQVICKKPNIVYKVRPASLPKSYFVRALLQKEPGCASLKLHAKQDTEIGYERF